MQDDVIFNKTSELTKEPFRQHFISMIKDYQEVLIVDLLQDKKTKEDRLSKEFHKLFYDSEFRVKNTLKFLHFDILNFCKNDQ